MRTFVDTVPVFRFVSGTRIHGHARNQADDILTDVMLSSTATSASINKPGVPREAVEYFEDLCSKLLIRGFYHEVGLFSGKF